MANEYIYAAKIITDTGLVVTKVGVSVRPFSRVDAISRGVGECAGIWWTGRRVPAARAYEKHILDTCDIWKGEYVLDTQESVISLINKLVDRGIPVRKTRYESPDAGITIELLRGIVVPLKQAELIFQKEYVAAALRQYKSISAAAEALGTNRTALYKILDRHGLKRVKIAFEEPA